MKTFSFDDIANVAKIVAEIAVAVWGYVAMPLNPMLARQIRGPLIVFVLVSGIWVMLLSKQDFRKRGKLVQQPLISLTVAIVSYFGAIYTTYLFDIYPPPDPFASLADLSIVFLYLVAFSLLSISCASLLRASGVFFRA